MSSSGDFLLTKSQMSHAKNPKASLDLSDNVSIFCFCPQDATMMVLLEPSSHEFWVPSVKVSPGASWLSTAQELTHDIFGEFLKVEELYHLHRLWVPKSGYVNHAIFCLLVKIDVKKAKNFHGRFKGNVKWCSFEDIRLYHTTNLLKSPELLEFISAKTNKTPPPVNTPQEYTNALHMVEINETALVTAKYSVLGQFLDGCGLDKLAQEILYKEFFLLCAPAIYLTYSSFCHFLTSLGWPKDEFLQLYRSADFNERGGISFREFLYFIAVTEPAIVFSGASAELRCRYIFKYLDTKRDNVLDRDELRSFIVMVRKQKKQPLDTLSIEQDLEACYKALGIQNFNSLTMSDFVQGVGELKIRGTSLMYHAPTSIHKFIKEVSERETKKKVPIKPAPSVEVAKKRYELAVHSVKINKIGATINIDPFWKIDHSSSYSSGSPLIPDVLRKQSKNKFDQNSVSNQLLKTLRYVVQLNAKSQCYSKIEAFQFSWGIVDPELFAKHLIELCLDLQSIFKSEPRMLRIQSPVYIMGDLHGNCSDLLTFEKNFWNVGPALCPSNLLFLGDYVDRGLFSLEVICYLFAYKFQSPQKVNLLRGNHEIRNIQLQWTFEKELKLKFGEKLGFVVFSSINDVFDALPLAAVIDESIFCCHGGIPPPWMCPVVTAIDDIPTVLDDPQDQSCLAWELLWNDPLKSKHMSEKIAMELMANEGFAANYRRGTAHIFSVEALEKFLSINGFTHLVRAHEVVEAGFYFQQKGQAMTIFSSSKYCGISNDAACLFVDQGKIRVLRLEIE